MLNIAACSFDSSELIGLTLYILMNEQMARGLPDKAEGEGRTTATCWRDGATGSMTKPTQLLMLRLHSGTRGMGA